MSLITISDEKNSEAKALIATEDFMISDQNITVFFWIAGFFVALVLYNFS